jgi:hypothetical protein
VNAASGFGPEPNVVIGVYVGRNPDKPTYHLPFRENVVIAAAGLDLLIVECVNPKIAADDPTKPVITIAATAGDGKKGGTTDDPDQPGERDIEILGVNVYNSNDAGVRIDSGVDGRVLLKGLRAENNGVGILVLGDNNDLNGNNSNTNGGIGYNIDGTGNKLKSNKASGNVVLQFDIEASNIDQGGNQANGAPISFGSGGGEF